MCKNDKGFTLIEALVAMSIVMLLVVTIVPIHILLKQERKILRDRRVITTVLHDELQQFIWESGELGSFARTVGNKKVDFDFVFEKELIKGCAEWENVKQEHEQVCLYGKKENG